MPLHYCTPVKAHILGTASFLDRYHIPYFKSNLFRHFSVSKTRGWDILAHPDWERRHLRLETRGRKPIITAEGLRKMEEIMWIYGFKARKLT